MSDQPRKGAFPVKVRLALPLFGALSGVTLFEPKCELIPGVTIEAGVVELLQTAAIAFAEPEEPNRHHPGPWAAVNGGSILKCRAIISITQLQPEFPVPTSSLLLYLVAASVRLQVDSPVRLALISSDPFAPGMPSRPSAFEVHTTHGGAFRSETQQLGASDIRSLKLSIPNFIRLFQDVRFNRAWTMFDAAQWCPGPDAATGMMWSAIETLFGIGAISRGKGKALARSASDFLATDRSQRDRFYQEITELYEERGGIVHNGRRPNLDKVGATFGLAKDLFSSIVRTGLMPPAAAM